MLNLVLEELDDPLYYVLDDIASIMHLETPNHSVFRSAIMNANYKVSYSHCNKNSVKTNAPNEVVWDILKEWSKIKPIKEKWLTPDYKVYHILNNGLPPASTDSAKEGDTKEPQKPKYDFTVRPDSMPQSKKSKMLRFQEPPPFWGPKARPKKRTASTEDNQQVETINESKKQLKQQQQQQQQQQMESEATSQ